MSDVASGSNSDGICAPLASTSIALPDTDVTPMDINIVRPGSDITLITLIVKGAEFGVPDATFVIEKDVALYCHALKDLIEDLGGSVPIPIMNIHPTTMSFVIRFIKQKHYEKMTAPPDERTDEQKEDDAEEAMISPPNTEYVNDWEKKFIEQFETEMLWIVCQAANTLDIPLLIDAWAKRAASMIRGKTREEMQDALLLTNDRTYEEQVALFEENGWQPPTEEEYQNEQERIRMNHEMAAADPFVIPPFIPEESVVI